MNLKTQHLISSLTIQIRKSQKCIHLNFLRRSNTSNHRMAKNLVSTSLLEDLLNLASKKQKFLTSTYNSQTIGQITQFSLREHQTSIKLLILIQMMLKDVLSNDVIHIKQPLKSSNHSFQKSNLISAMITLINWKKKVNIRKLNLKYGAIFIMKC